LRNITVIVILAGLILIGFQSPFIHTLGAYRDDRNPLQTAFQASGAQFNNLTFSGWAQINSRFSSKEELREYSFKLANSLGVNPKELGELVQEDHNFRGVVLRGRIKPNAYLEIYSQSMQGGQTADIKPETYITAVLTIEDNDNQLDQWKTGLEEAFQAVSSQQGQVFTILTGTFDGRKTMAENKAIADKIFAYLGTKPIEGVTNERMVSLTGYTKAIKEKLVIGEKKLNINVAVRYNNLEDKTYIIIGSPIIATEY